ncbi:MAG: ubiquinol-cytochrome C chaperone family protein [Hyphomonas sp.]|uniref:ubiquinol-cytochrome C chaperone family protein n=1 Tax=Hyphomonas sp. TaxID=87 RepID=UPI0034A09594
MTAFSGNWFQRRTARRKAAGEAYRRLLRQALEPSWYLESAVSDTFDGRARMITLLTSLAIDRLSRIAGPDIAPLAARLDELVLDGFDAAFREKGVGDASIARKVRKLAQEHAGLGKALFAALKDDSKTQRAAQVDAVLRRNGVVAPGHAGALATTLLDLQAHLAAQPDEEILHGRFDWMAAGAGQGTLQH